MRPIGSIIAAAALLLMTPGAGPSDDRRILSPADIEFVGAMRVPIAVTGYGRGGRMTHRVVDDQLRFFLAGHTHQNGPIYEIDAPGFGPNWQTAPRANVVRVWGNVYQGRKQIGNVGSEVWTEDLEWFDGQLYWVYGDSYNTVGNDDAVIGLSQLGGSAAGPWQTSLHNKLTRGYVTVIPQWYADRFLEGRRFAIGSGLRSGNDRMSWGPNLNAIPVPTAQTPTSQRLSAVKLVEHFVDFAYLDGASCCDFRAARENTYTSYNPPFVRNGGWWTDLDVIHSAVWIDLPDLHGVIFMGSLGAGRLWYGGPNGPGGARSGCGIDWQGTHAESYEKRWWIYDPMQFSVVTGRPPQDVQPASILDPNIVARDEISTCIGWPSGASFEPSTRMLYVAYMETEHNGDDIGNLPVIYAFRVHGGAGCQVPNSAPSPLSVSQSGRYVLLQWAVAAGATDYVLEVGSASGASDILIQPLGSVTTMDANAPAGVYFVRIRGRNACGQSAPSNELRVVVP